MICANRKEEGFTLVELLIVVAIIGILAAIAIPQFALYRERAYCSAQESDLANLAIAQEAYFVDYSTYAAATTALADFRTSTSNTISIAVTAGSPGVPAAFTAIATHPGCLQGGPSAWNSALGGLQ